MFLLVLGIVVGLVFLWFFLASIVAHIILPNQMFETKIQRTKRIKTLANKLKSKDELETLKNVYSYVIKNYIGDKEKFKLLIVPRLFRYNLDKILDRKNYFIACHIQNKIIITLLINSGQFKREDMEKKHNITNWLTIHQYLIVRIGIKKYKVDPFYHVFKKL